MNKFDEAIEKTRELSMDGTQQMYVDDVIGIIDRMREPTVEMTQNQNNLIEYHLAHSTLQNLINTFMENRGQIEFGIKHTDLMRDLSLEDIARAWLDPNVIKVVEEEQ